MAGDERRQARQHREPVGAGDVQDVADGRSQVRIGAGRLLEVVRPALGSRECARRPHPRGGGSDPAAALDRALPQCDRPVPVHAALRRQRRARVRAGLDDRRGRDRHHLDAVAALVPRQPVSLRRRRPETGGDGAVARADRPRRAGRRRPRAAALRRARRALSRARGGTTRRPRGARPARAGPRRSPARRSSCSG